MSVILILLPSSIEKALSFAIITHAIDMIPSFCYGILAIFLIRKVSGYELSFAKLLKLRS